uniref:hypothetical protein n=1 Tax=Ruegeria profundi TaxID=1685378 RepID=UPI001CD77FDF
TAKRMISGLVLKYLKEAGLVMGKSYATPLPHSSNILLTRPYSLFTKHLFYVLNIGAHQSPEFLFMID